MVMFFINLYGITNFNFISHVYFFAFTHSSCKTRVMIYLSIYEHYVIASRAGVCIAAQGRTAPGRGACNGSCDLITMASHNKEKSLRSAWILPSKGTKLF